MRVDEPPTYRQYELLTGISYVGEPDNPMPYAIDFTHGKPSDNRSVGIYLHFDGSVRLVLR